MNERGYLLTLIHRPTVMSVHVFDPKGQSVCQVQRSLDRDSETVGDYHLQADAALSSAITLMESGLRRASITAYEVCGIGFSVSCHTLVLWNGVSGTPLLTVDTPSNWPQLGGAEAAAFLRVATSAAMAEAGAPTQVRDLRLGGMDSWLLWSLTQSEWSLVEQGHDLTLYAYGETGMADAEFAAKCGLTAGCFPLLSSPAKLPRISSIYLDAARPPICALTYTQTAALVGARLETAGAAFITYDREGAVAISVPDRSKSRLVASAALGYRPLLTLDRGVFAVALVGRFTSPQRVAAWLDTYFGSRIELTEVAGSLAEPGPLILPVHSGWPGQASIIGLDSDTSPAALYASALRAVAFTVAQIVEQAEQVTGVRVDALYTDELAYGIPALFSFQAGLCKSPLYARTGDSSALGAAALAGIHAGLWSRERAESLLDEQYTSRRYDIPLLDENVWEQFQLWKQAIGS